jgi:Ca2+-binding RTX toxin-like protein
VVSWDQEGTSSDIRYRVFNTDGTAATSDSLVNTTTASLQGQSSIAKLSNGGFVFTWTSDEGTTNGQDIRARVFSANGTAGDDFVVNSGRTNAQDAPVVTQLANGNLVFAWSAVNTAGSDRDIKARIFTSSGTAIGNDIAVNTSGQNNGGAQLTPAVHALSDGRFFVAWESSESNFEIRGRYFSATGTASAQDFVINSANSTDLDPAIAVLRDGRVLIAWTAKANLAAEGEIRARVYNTDGTQAGPDFVVNSTISGDQKNSSLKVLADGRVAVSWTSAGEIRSTIVNPLVFNGTDSGDSWSAGGYSERLYGFGGADTILGNGGADKIYGDAGNDVLRGGTSGDSIYGGADNDELFGDSSGDKLYGEVGNDTLDGGSSNDVLYGGAGADALIGGTGTDYASYYYSAAAVKAYLDGSATNAGDAAGDTFNSVENLSGSNVGGDSLKGNSGTNTIRGNGGADSISGGDGDDTIVGGSGSDRLSGGVGRDKFSYESLADTGDTLTSFSTSDYFVFKGSAFGNLKTGTLSSSAFWANTTGSAHDTTDRFILETDTGILRYDSNGSTAGGTKATIADVDGTFTMSHADILIV